MAAAHASAASLGVPLFEYLGGAEATLLPMPQIQIFGGGAHAGRAVDIQDFMVVCPARRASPRRWSGPPRSTAMRAS
jgi:enolase